MWQSEQRGKCPEHGTFRWEWDDNPQAWFVDHETWPCCQLVDSYRRELQQGQSPLDGVRIGLWKQPRED